MGVVGMWGADRDRLYWQGIPIPVGELERSLLLLDKEFVSDMLRWLFMIIYYLLIIIIMFISLKKHSSGELKN